MTEIKITYKQAIDAVRLVRKLHDKTGAFLDTQGHNPLPASLAAKELAEFQRPESVLTAYSQGIALIELAGDHLVAFTKTITQPAQSIAPWTIARSVLEASALSCWLLDPRIDVRTRVQRSLAYRYDGQVEQSKFARAAGNVLVVEQGNQRIEEIESMAESIGFAKLRSDSDKRTGIGQVMPSVTEVVRDTLDEEANYRLYSAMAHAHSWAYSQLGFRKGAETQHGDVKGHFIEKHLANESVWILCASVARYFARPVRYRTELYGWGLEKLSGIISDVFKKMGVREK